VFEYELGPAESADAYAIDEYTVVGGSEIWLSTAGRGNVLLRHGEPRVETCRPLGATVQRLRRLRPRARPLVRFH
jgi:hypothetical protein